MIIVVACFDVKIFINDESSAVIHEFDSLEPISHSVCVRVFHIGDRSGAVQKFYSGTLDRFVGFIFYIYFLEPFYRQVSVFINQESVILVGAVQDCKIDLIAAHDLYAVAASRPVYGTVINSDISGVAGDIQICRSRIADVTSGYHGIPVVDYSYSIAGSIMDVCVRYRRGTVGYKNTGIA